MRGNEVGPSVDEAWTRTAVVILRHLDRDIETDPAGRYGVDVFYPFQLSGLVAELECVEVGGRWVVVACGGKYGAEVQVFDAVDGEVVADYSLGSATNRPLWSFRAVDVGGQSRLMIGIDHHHRPDPDAGSYFVRLFDLLSGAAAGPVLPCPGPIRGVHSYLLDGRPTVVAVDRGGGITQFDAATGRQVRPMRHHDGADIFISGTVVGRAGPLGTDIAAVGSRDDGSLSVWDLVQAEPIWAERTNGTDVFALSVRSVADTPYLAVARSSKYVEVRDALTGIVLAQPLVPDPNFPPRIGLWQRDGRLTLFIGNGEHIDYLDVASGAKIWPTMLWPAEIMVVHPTTVDGRDVLFVGDDYVLCMLDAVTGELILGSLERDVE